MVVLLDATNAFDRAELSTVDTRFEIRGERPVPKDVVVVGIDDVTFDELKERWVFSRLTFARALRGITRDRPKAIAYDVEFVENTGDRPEDIEADNALVLASRAARNVVFSATAVSKEGTTNIFGGLEGQKFGRATVGNGLLPEGTGGVLRRVPYKIDGLKTLSVATVEQATRRPVDPDWFAGGGAWIDFAGPPGHFKEVSFSRAVRRQLPAGHVPDKIVVIGATAPVLQDTHPTSWPAGRDGRARDPRERDRHAAAGRAAARRERARRPPDRDRPHAAARAARAAAAAAARARARRSPPRSSTSSSSSSRSGRA